MINFKPKFQNPMEKQIINTNQAPAPIGPYSQAVKIGNTLYVSGQIALNPETNQLDNADIQTETKRVLQNLQAILHAAGTDLKNVLKCTIFVKDMNNFGLINEVYGTYFNAQPPARETVEVSRLPKDVGVEISCIAVVL
jgi:2-iminobutanoate/2-iminopropanoate deaminase